MMNSTPEPAHFFYKMQTAMNNAFFVLGDGLQAIKIVRAPLLIAIVTGFILVVPDQTIEIYRVLAIDYADKVTQVWIAFATLLLAAFFFFQFAYHLALVNRAKLRSKCGKTTLAALPSLCAILIPIGAAYGTCVANVSPTVVGPWASVSTAYKDYANAIAPISSRLTVATVICLMIAVASLAFSVRTVLKGQEFHKRYLNSRWSIFGLYPTMLFFIFGGVSITVFAKNSGTLAGTIGVVTIVLQFSILVAFFASSLSLYYYRYRIPFIMGIVLLAVGFSAANINDNHVVRILAYPPRQSKPVERSFVEWYQGRADRVRFEESGNPYPVFLVSAAGGGIYAAYHAAQVLARLADRCPNFAQHVFAISGVSGGSLGAAVFSSLAKDLAANGPPEYCRFGGSQSGPFEKRARQMLSHDFLAPTLKFNPKSARAYVSLGDAYEQKSDYGSAIADYSQAIALDQAYDEARALRGRVYLHEGRYDLAIADENVAIRLNDNRLGYYEYRGDAYSMKGDLDGAIADYTEIINSKPVRSVLSQIAKRARAYAGKNDYDAAIADYTTAIRYDPWKSKNYLLERAKVYKAKGDIARANSDIHAAWMAPIR